MTCHQQTKEHRGNLLQTGLYFIVLACFFLTTKSTSATAETAKINSSNTSELMVRIENTEQAFTVLQNKMKNLVMCMEDIQKTTETFVNRDMKKTIDELETRTLNRQNELKKLNADIKKLEDASKKQNQKRDLKDIGLLEKQVQKSRDELDRLTQKHNELLGQNQTGKSGGFQEGRVFSGMKGILVFLVQNNVADCNSPYYEFTKKYTVHDGMLVSYIKISRIKDGQPIAEAIKEGGLLSSILDHIDPQKEYVRFMVTSDSISAYRIATKEALSRKIKYTWSTWKDEDIYIRIDGIDDNTSDNDASILFGSPK